MKEFLKRVIREASWILELIYMNHSDDSVKWYKGMAEGGEAEGMTMRATSG